MRCGGCSFKNPPGMRFCGKCGLPLAAQAPARSPASAERRHLSVLFCDLAVLSDVDYGMDPDALRQLVDRLHEVCADPVARYEGRIAKHLDTGVLAHFGYPVAHEDDAERAVRAAWEIVATLTEGAMARDGKDDPGASVRAGIHTGLEVVGDVASQDRWRQLAVGPTHNLAARLKDAAEPGTVLVSEETFRLIEGSVRCDALGPIAVRGLDDPIPVFRVTEIVDAGTRFRRRAATRLTPIVGRGRELRALEDGWDEARSGRTRCLAVVADAGIGKSRLIEAFHERIADADPLTVEMQCSPYYRNTALHPVAEMLERRFGLDRSQPLQGRSEQLRNHISQTGLDQDRAPALLASLLSLPLPQGVTPLELSPEHRRKALDDLLIDWMADLAGQGPVVCVVEDLHWADPSTLTLLERWIAAPRSLPVLTVLTYRPREVDWVAPPQVREIPLGRLVRDEVRTMLAHLAGAKALTPEAVSELTEKSDGVPLFIEELARTVVEGPPTPSDDTARRGASAIPERLYDSLLARLDRLGTAKEVAQLASVMGRTFDLESLVDVSYLDRSVITHDLDQLVEAGVIFESLPGEQRFTFQHALLQEAAYESLLKKQRRTIHRQFAQSIEARLPEVATTRPELLAQHYTEADLPHRAVPYWQRAGHAALGSHAMVEGIRHLSAGLSTLESLESSPQRDVTELGLLAALGPAVMATEGFGGPEVSRVYRRAERVTSRMEHTIEIFPALFGIHRYHAMCGHREDALRLALQVLDLAERRGTRAQTLAARQALAVTHFHMGSFAAAREQLELGLELAGGEFELPKAYLYGLHPVVGCHSYLGYTLAFQGLPDRAISSVERAREITRALDDPLLEGFVLNALGFVHQLRKEPERVLSYSEEALAIGTARSFPTVVLWAKVLKGWALDALGDDRGVALLEQGLSDWTASGVRATLTHILATLAEIYVARGRLVDADRLLDRAEALMTETGERFYEPGLLRIRGDRIRRDPTGELDRASLMYSEAVRIARERDSSLLERQATEAYALIQG